MGQQQRQGDLNVRRRRRNETRNRNQQQFQSIASLRSVKKKTFHHCARHVTSVRTQSTSRQLNWRERVTGRKRTRVPVLRRSSKRQTEVVIFSLLRFLTSTSLLFHLSLSLFLSLSYRQNKKTACMRENRVGEERKKRGVADGWRVVSFHSGCSSLLLLIGAFFAN